MRSLLSAHIFIVRYDYDSFCEVSGGATAVTNSEPGLMSLGSCHVGL